MNATVWLYPAAVIVSSLVAALAWWAKLRWSQEFRDATGQVLQAKNAEIESLKTRIDTLEAVSSGKLLERAASTKVGLEGIIEEKEAELQTAQDTIETLRRQIDDLERARSTDLALDRNSAPANASAEVSEELEHVSQRLDRQLHLAQKDKERLEAETLRLRLIQLQRAPEMLERESVRMAEMHAQLQDVESELALEREQWLERQHETEAKLQTYRENAQELKHQIESVREAGADGICPTCDRPLGDVLDTMVGRLEDEWDTLIKDGKWLKQRLDELRQRPQRLVQAQDRLAALRYALDDQAAKVARLAVAAHEYEVLRTELEGQGCVSA